MIKFSWDEQIIGDDSQIIENTYDCTNSETDNSEEKKEENDQLCDSRIKGLTFQTLGSLRNFLSNFFFKCIKAFTSKIIRR